MSNSIKGTLVSQFPTYGSDVLAEERSGRNPYREASPRPLDADVRADEELDRIQEEARKRITMLDIDDNWPASVSRDQPDKLSAETKAHSFFVRTSEPDLLTNIDVFGFIAKCPDAGDGKGVVVHRDVIQSLAYHLLDKVHELEKLRRDPPGKDPRYDERLSRALDQLGTKDGEIKELRAALGEATVKIRRLESKPFR